jgi:hypothetical protein
MTAARHDQLPHSDDESEPLGDVSPAWSPEQSTGKGTDMTPREMEDFEEGVVHGDPDSNTVPPTPASPD